MLHPLLKPTDCAACRVCCVFDQDDIWEQPVFGETTAARVRALLPEAKLERIGEFYRICPDGWDGYGLFTCPMLNPKSGCVLGADKPFDCRIWPFRIMELSGRRVITIASLCEAMTRQSLTDLLAFLQDGLAGTIFSYAAQHPEIVKPYEAGYPILQLEQEK